MRCFSLNDFRNLNGGQFYSRRDVIEISTGGNSTADGTISGFSATGKGM